MKLRSLYYLSILIGVSSFSHLIPTQVLNEKYNLYYNKKVNFDLYHEKICFKIKNQTVIKDNKFVYRKMIELVRQILKATNSKISIKNITNENDKIFVTWQCSLFTDCNFSSTYRIGADKKIKEHSIDWYKYDFYPRIPCPVRVRSGS